MKRVTIFMFLVMAFFLWQSCRINETIQSVNSDTYQHQTASKAIEGQTAGTSKKIIGYFCEWSIYAAHNYFQVSQIPFDKLTHINYAFAGIDTSTFQLKVLDSWATLEKVFPPDGYDTPYKGNLGQLRKYKELYPHIRTMISIGGWTKSNGFHQMALTQTGRQTFANSCVRFIRTHNMDGVDLDWEYPGIDRPKDTNDPYDEGSPGGPEDTENFTQLLKTLRETLDAAGQADGRYYELSIAAGSGYDKIALTNPQDYAPYLDHINLMTYDFHGGFDIYTGHQAPLYSNPNEPYDGEVKEKYNIDWVVNKFLSFDIPSEKIIIGLPFYARGWNYVSGGTNGMFGTGSGSLQGLWGIGGQSPYHHVRTVLQGDSSFQKFRDEYSKVPWLYSASRAEVYTYDDEISIGVKCDYINSLNLGGAMYWEIDGDYNNTLGDIVYNKMEEGISVTPTPDTGYTSVPTQDITPTPESGTDNYPSYDNLKVYTGGDRVSHNGSDWEAQWWTQGEAPSTEGSGVWQLLSEPVITPIPGENPIYPLYDNATVYVMGDRVTYNKADWEARWWTLGEPPSTEGTGVWTLLNGISVTQTPTVIPTDAPTPIPATPTPDKRTPTPENPTPAPSPVPTSEPIGYLSWDSSTVYLQGDKVTHAGQVWEAQWWTQGAEPGTTGEWGVWRYAGNAAPTSVPTAIPTSDPDNTPVPTAENQRDFKIVGYYPSWETDANSIPYDKLTHINYAFLIPTARGDIYSLENPKMLQAIVTQAHAAGVKVLMAVGGWSYNNGTPLDSVFEALAKNTDSRNNLVSNLISLVNQYNLDGIDIDWEFPDPPTEGNGSAEAFSTLMSSLSLEMHSRGKLLTAAVHAGATPDLEDFYWAYGVQSDVFAMVDFLNVMAYDGGDGERHSPYLLAEKSINYWTNIRGCPKEKVILGVPFYGRPSWAAYKEIVAQDPDAPFKDVSKGVYYNGLSTIKAKTQLAKVQAGGIMIWELSQDTSDDSSLLDAINEAARL